MKDFCVAQEKKLTEGQQSMAKLKTFIYQSGLERRADLERFGMCKRFQQYLQSQQQKDRNKDRAKSPSRKAADSAEQTAKIKNNDFTKQA